MQILSTNGWEDYELIDSGARRRLERFGKYIISRPDPQAIWSKKRDKKHWQDCDAFFKQESEGKGTWITYNKIPDKWLMRYNDISFYASLTPFKHTGVFPEQKTHWDWMRESIKNAHRPINVLNLFGYTGISTLICAKNKATVTHIDASKPAITWARENAYASGLQNSIIRWIPDDAIKFTTREIRRGTKYDAILLDPPVYGHGTHGERWDFYKDFPLLLTQCKQLLSNNPLFMLINAYAVSSSSIMLENCLSDLHMKGTIESGELAIEEKENKRLFSTGIYARMTF